MFGFNDIFDRLHSTFEGPSYLRGWISQQMNAFWETNLQWHGPQQEWRIQLKLPVQQYVCVCVCVCVCVDGGRVNAWVLDRCGCVQYYSLGRQFPWGHRSHTPLPRILTPDFSPCWSNPDPITRRVSDPDLRARSAVLRPEDVASNPTTETNRYQTRRLFEGEMINSALKPAMNKECLVATFHRGEARLNEVTLFDCSFPVQSGDLKNTAFVFISFMKSEGNCFMVFCFDWLIDWLTRLLYLSVLWKETGTFLWCFVFKLIVCLIDWLID